MGSPALGLVIGLFGKTLVVVVNSLLCTRALTVVVVVPLVQYNLPECAVVKGKSWIVTDVVGWKFLGVECETLELPRFSSGNGSGISVVLGFADTSPSELAGDPEPEK